MANNLFPDFKRSPLLGGEFGTGEDRSPRLGGEAAFEHLVELLDHPQWPVRRRAVFRLARLNDLDGAGALVRALGDPHKKVREAALQAAGQCDPALIVPLLAAALSDPTHPSQASVAVALGLLTHPAGIPALSSALRSEDGNLRLHAAAALAHIGDPALDALVESAGDPDWRVRLAAVWALERLIKPGGIDTLAALRLALRRAATDDHPEVRHLAGRALARAGDLAAVPELIEMLNSADAFAREDAAICLGDLRVEEAITALAARLTDSERGWRGAVGAAAEVALEKIGTSEARAALKAYREKQDELHRKGARGTK